jgi:hypothetical protein
LFLFWKLLLRLGLLDYSWNDSLFDSILIDPDIGKSPKLNCFILRACH